jgi:hypothetical protein
MIVIMGKYNWSVKAICIEIKELRVYYMYCKEKLTVIIFSVLNGE